MVETIDRITHGDLPRALEGLVQELTGQGYTKEEIQAYLQAKVLEALQGL